jgi:hypothetical protein
MAHQNGLDTNSREDAKNDTKFTNWIIVGAVILVIVVAGGVFTSTGNYPDRPQTTTTVPAPSPSTAVPDTARLTSADR